MAISFSNTQIAQMSKAILTLPTEIEASKNAQSNQAAGKVELKTKDDNNKTFYDHFHNVVNQYHAELLALDGTQKTNYSDADLDAGARQSAGNLHYPITPSVWMGLKPKVLDSNKGLPSSNIPGAHEVYWESQLEYDLGIFLDGWTDGAVNTTTTTTYNDVSGVTLSSAAGLAIGHRVVLYNGSDGMYGTVSGISGNNVQFAVIIPPTGILNSGSTLKNNFPGFTNTERESGTAARQTMFNGMKIRINNEVSQYKTYLQNEQTALAANGVGTPENSEIVTAKANVDAQISTVTTWQANPDTGVGVAKWGDTKIVPFRASVLTRKTFVVTRISQVNFRLGTLTQNSEGDYSGTGNYLKLFDWISLRISKVGGTLLQFYMSDLGGKALGEQTGSLEKQLTEYKNVFAVTKFTSDGNGTDTIEVDNVAEFMPNDSVMIIDDDTPFISRVILSISGKSVRLNGVVGSDFKVDTTARLVKQK